MVPSGVQRAPSVYHLAPLPGSANPSGGGGGGGTFSFRDVLLEPDAVTYAMEYLERQRHAARAQFWLLIEGLKDPLEDFDGEEVVLPPFGPKVHANRDDDATAAADDEARRAYLEDIRMVWDVYLAQDSFRSSPALLEAVKAFALRTSTPSPSDPYPTATELRAVRYALFAIQQEVLTLLEEEDWPGFVQSDLYFRAASTLAAASTTAATTAAAAAGDVALTPPPYSRPLPIVTPPTPGGPRTLPGSGADSPPAVGLGAGAGGRAETSSRPASPTPPLLMAWMPRTRSSSPRRRPRASSPSPPPRPSPPPPPPPSSSPPMQHSVGAAAVVAGQRSDLVAATRTSTAPPQVSFHTVFDHPHSRSQTVTAGDSSSNATVGVSGSDGAGAGAGAGPGVAPAVVGRKTPPMQNNSLEFLISPIPDAVDRTPLFVGGEREGGSEDLLEAHEEEQAAERGRLETALLEAEEDDDSFVQVQTIDAIQDALSSILATSDARGAASRLDSSVSSLPSLRDDASTSSKAHGRRQSASSFRSSEPAGTATSVPPSSPGIGGPPPLPARRSRPVFDDPETYDDTTPDSDPAESSDPFPPLLDRPPVPLTRTQLAEESQRLEEQLAKLASQQGLVEALIRKAELTGNAVELKILVKSRESLAREIRATAYQRDQLAAQAADDEISSRRTRITIPGTSVGQVNNLGTQTFQLYLVEVRQLSGEAGTTQAAWIVTKRYSEFAALHDKLRDRYPAARTLDFPSKRLVGAWSKEFIEQRRLGLERYLQVSSACGAHSSSRAADPRWLRPRNSRSCASRRSVPAKNCAHSSRKSPSPCPRLRTRRRASPSRPFRPVRALCGTSTAA